VTRALVLWLALLLLLPIAAEAAVARNGVSDIR
jgi:hypothetical protein